MLIPEKIWKTVKSHFVLHLHPKLYFLELLPRHRMHSSGYAANLQSKGAMQYQGFLRQRRVVGPSSSAREINQISLRDHLKINKQRKLRTSFGVPINSKQLRKKTTAQETTNTNSGTERCSSGIRMQLIARIPQI